MSIDSWTFDSMVNNKNRDLPKGKINHLGYDIPKLVDGSVKDVAGSDQLICVSLKYDDGRKVSLSVGHETLLYQSTRLGVSLTIWPYRKSVNRSLIKRLRRGQTISVLRWADAFLSECPSQFDHGNAETLTHACAILARFASKSVTAYAGNNAAGCLIRLGDTQDNPGAAALLAIARWVNWRTAVKVTGTNLHPSVRNVFLRTILLQRHPMTSGLPLLANKILAKRSGRCRLHMNSLLPIACGKTRSCLRDTPSGRRSPGGAISHRGSLRP